MYKHDLGKLCFILFWNKSDNNNNNNNNSIGILQGKNQCFYLMMIKGFWFKFSLDYKRNQETYFFIFRKLYSTK